MPARNRLGVRRACRQAQRSRSAPRPGLAAALVTLLAPSDPAPVPPSRSARPPPKYWPRPRRAATGCSRRASQAEPAVVPARTIRRPPTALALPVAVGHGDDRGLAAGKRAAPADPPAAAPPPPLPPPDIEPVVTAPVVVAPRAAPVGFVLVRVVPEEVVVDAGLTVATVGEAISAGSRTAPVPTWPLPRAPGVAPVRWSATAPPRDQRGGEQHQLRSRRKSPSCPRNAGRGGRFPMSVGRDDKALLRSPTANRNGLPWRRHQARPAPLPCRS